MARRLVAGLAFLVLVADVLVGFVVPAVAESLLQQRLAEDLAGRFGVPVRIEVDVVTAGTLFRGEVAAIDLEATGYRSTVDEVVVEVQALAISLEGVEVDRDAALAGELSTIGVRRGTFRATISLDQVKVLVADRLAQEHPELAVVEVAPMGARLVVTVAGPDGQAVGVQVTVAIRDGAIVAATDPPGPDEAPAAQVARQALDGLRMQLPELPLGLELSRLEVVGTTVVATGPVPSVLDIR